MLFGKAVANLFCQREEAPQKPRRESGDRPEDPPVALGAFEGVRRRPRGALRRRTPIPFLKHLSILCAEQDCHPWPFSTLATRENADGFRGCRPPYPPAADSFHGLLGRTITTGGSRRGFYPSVQFYRNPAPLPGFGGPCLCRWPAAHDRYSARSHTRHHVNDYFGGLPGFVLAR